MFLSSVISLDLANFSYFCVFFCYFFLFLPILYNLFLISREYQQLFDGLARRGYGCPGLERSVNKTFHRMRYDYTVRENCNLHLDYTVAMTTEPPDTTVAMLTMLVTMGVTIEPETDSKQNGTNPQTTTLRAAKQQEFDIYGNIVINHGKQENL